ncbi:MAG TPA: oligosaccharide flippase family protein [Thermodesulfobacteriota bacterium]|nr:oligosaccharide flippase family protein [Thermodesulfobacteriota bacterium]
MDSGESKGKSEIKKRSVTKGLFRNASWLLGGKTASGIFSALQTIILARMLGVTDYGLLVLVIAYVDILNQFFDFRVWETATKYIGTYWTKGEKEKALSMIKLSYIIDISSGILAFVIAVITSKIASRYFIHSPEAYYLICIYAFSLLIDTANSTSYAILRVLDRFKNIAFISSLTSFFRLALVLVALYLGMGIKGVLFSYIAATFLGFVIRLWAVSKTLKENGLERWWQSDVGLIKDQWRGIAWFLGNTSLTATIKMAGDNYLGVLVLGYFSGKEAVGLYKVAKSFVKIIGRITDPLYEAIYPELVKATSLDSLKDFKKLLKYSTKNLMKIIIPIAIITIIFADQFLNIIFGKEYLPATNALRIITLAVVIYKLIFWLNPALLAFGRPGLRTISGAASMTLYVVLLLILVPKFSYIGAAFAFLGFSIVRSLISILALKISVDDRKKFIQVSASQPIDREAKKV